MLLKRRKTLLLLIVVMFTVSTGLYAQSFTHMLSFQGRLCETGGKPLPDDTYDVVFRIYNTDTGGTGLWEETQTVTQVGGVFNVFLGTIVPFPADLFTGGDRWLALRIVGDSEMPDRFRVCPNAWAIFSEDAAHANEADYAAEAGHATEADHAALADLATNATHADDADHATNADHATTADSATEAGNADTVDNLHASDTPMPGYLLALDGGSMLPLSTIPQGTGSGLDADMVDTFHASSTPTPDYILPLDGSGMFPLSVIPQGEGSGLNADLLDGLDSTYFADAGHHHDAAYVNEGQADSITSSMIVDGRVGTADLAGQAVTTTKIAPGAVTGGKIADGTVTQTDAPSLVSSANANVRILTGSIVITDPNRRARVELDRSYELIGIVVCNGHTGASPTPVGLLDDWIFRVTDHFWVEMIDPEGSLPCRVNYFGCGIPR